MMAVSQSIPLMVQDLTGYGNTTQQRNETNGRVRNFLESLRQNSLTTGKPITVSQVLAALNGYNIINAPIPASQANLLVNSTVKTGDHLQIPEIIGVNPAHIAYFNRLIHYAAADNLPTETQMKQQAAARRNQFNDPTFITALLNAQGTNFDPADRKNPNYVQNIKKAKRLLGIKSSLGYNIHPQILYPGTVASFALGLGGKKRIAQAQRLLSLAGIYLNDNAPVISRTMSNIQDLKPRILKEKGRLPRADGRAFANSYLAPKLNFAQRQQRVMAELPKDFGQGLTQKAKPLFPLAQRSYLDKKANMASKINAYIRKKEQISNPDTIWPDQIYGQVVFNPNSAKWEGVTKSGKKFLSNSDPTASYVRNKDMATYLLSSTITQPQLVQQLPTLVQSLVKENAQYSKYGIGPISKNSLSLYVGRWYDPTTARVRIMPTASRKFVNKRSWQSMNQYYKARVLNKWNQYVEAQEGWEKHQNKKSSYDRIQNQRAQKALYAIKQGNIYDEIYEKAAQYWLQYQITPSAALPKYKRILRPALTPMLDTFRDSFDDPKVALQGLDIALARAMENIANPAAFTTNFPDNYSGRSQRTRAINWLNSQTNLVARKIIKQLQQQYKATFKINGANSSQMNMYRETLKSASDIYRRIGQNQFTQFRQNPTMANSLPSLLAQLGRVGAYNGGAMEQQIPVNDLDNVPAGLGGQGLGGQGLGGQGLGGQGLGGQGLGGQGQGGQGQGGQGGQGQGGQGGQQEQQDEFALDLARRRREGEARRRENLEN